MSPAKDASTQMPSPLHLVPPPVSALLILGEALPLGPL